MGSKVEHPEGGDLYSFWGDRVTDALNADLDASPGSRVLVNLASNEYFGAVRTDRVDGRIVTPKFLDAKGDDDYKMVSFFAKRARGAMAGWIIRKRIKSARALVEFDGAGYRYDPVRSVPNEPVFLRRNDA
jgi:hypothetical protein